MSILLEAVGAVVHALVEVAAEVFCRNRGETQEDDSSE